MWFVRLFALGVDTKVLVHGAYDMKGVSGFSGFKEEFLFIPAPSVRQSVWCNRVFRTMEAVRQMPPYWSPRTLAANQSSRTSPYKAAQNRRLQYGFDQMEPCTSLREAAPCSSAASNCTAVHGEHCGQAAHT